MMPTMMLVMNAVSVLIVWVGGTYIDAGTIQTGDMIAFITYSMVIVMSFLMIGMIAIMLPRADVAARRVNEVLETESSIADPVQSKAGELDSSAEGLTVQFDHVTFAYNRGSSSVLDNIDFTAEPGQTTAIIGPTGSGKSSIIKLLCGEDVPHAGTLKTASGLVVSYIPQSAEGLSGTLRDYAEHCGIDESLFKSILRKLEFQRTQFEKRMEDFSEGQKKKVLIARSLCEKAHLLVWDEPLNFIDVISRMQLETLLKECVPTVIFVEHDRRFVENVATKIIRL